MVIGEWRWCNKRGLKSVLFRCPDYSQYPREETLRAEWKAFAEEDRRLRRPLVTVHLYHQDEESSTARVSRPMVEGNQAYINRITVADAEAHLSCHYGEECYVFVAIGGIAGTPPMRWRPPPTLSLEGDPEGFVFRFQIGSSEGLLPKKW